MNIEKLKFVFEKKIKPKLGRVQNQEKYFKVLIKLSENYTENDGKGIRAAEISEKLHPVNHTLNKLAEKGCVEVTLPIGDGKLIVDPLNNRKELFKKAKMIEDYYEKFRLHLEDDLEVREIAKKVLSINNDWQLNLWLERLEEQKDFCEYNQVVFKLLEHGIEVQKNFYGPLLWRKMANYYNISSMVKNLLEE